MNQPLPVTQSIKLIESLYVQLGFAGLFIVAMFFIMRYLFKQIREIKEELRDERNKSAILIENHRQERETYEKNHREEWEKLKKEHSEDRKTWAKQTEDNLKLIIATMKENSNNFTKIVEGVLKENNQQLAEVASVIKGCKKYSFN